MEKKYWADFFSNNIPTWDQVFKNSGLKGTHFLNFLEIGCFEGRATNYLLENVLTGTDCKIHVIDIFTSMADNTDIGYDFSNMYDTFVNNVSDNLDKVVIHQGKSGNILRTEFKNDFFDFIYIDGSHDAPDVLQDAVLCHPLLKKGGILIFDDYAWMDPKKPDPIYRPQLAIDFFYSLYKYKYEVIFQGYQVGLRKIAD